MFFLYRYPVWELWKNNCGGLGNMGRGAAGTEGVRLGEVTPFPMGMGSGEGAVPPTQTIFQLSGSK